MKKVIVTGINGLIGQYIAKPLQELDFEVYGIGRGDITTDNFHYIKTDINNPIEIENVFDKIKAEYLIHLAWDIKDLNSHVHFELFLSSLLMLKHFIKNGGKKVIFIGTCSEYDFYDRAIKETDNVNPRNLYSKYKNYLREISEFYCLKNNIDFCWARVFYVYGKNENPKRIFPYIINNLKENKKVVINHSQLKKDYMFAGDVAKAIALITNSNFNGIINICSGKPISLKEFALIIAKKMNKEYLLELKELNTEEPNILLGDNSKLVHEIGFNEYSNIEDIIDKLIMEY
ncbi:NAD(P)-dependent oxidoreductase [Brachyspira sp. SAP_772]|uniref:NAD-dependent epimerase/dehydratase family protein n=1 Tax=Brachyspira sp. SAP_772 TaxID=2608385 RepID=UPI0012F4CCDC|nr:NAD(P)-dependent oxidoreductase [Brachyspira sp. SAP_772]